ncbi:Lin0512 family protein [Reyranella sp.]
MTTEVVALARRARPDQVDTREVMAVLPHGTGTVKVVEGGLEIPMKRARTRR